MFLSICHAALVAGMYNKKYRLGSAFCTQINPIRIISSFFTKFNSCYLVSRVLTHRAGGAGDSIPVS
jgi:hypothetical protein